MDRAFDRAQGSVICLWVGLSTERVCGRGVAGVDTACRRPVRVTQALSCGRGCADRVHRPYHRAVVGVDGAYHRPCASLSSGYLYQP